MTAMRIDEAEEPLRLRPEALGAPSSGIIDVFNYGRGRQGLIPLWVGEGDRPTPGFISAAAAKSLEAGETFYTYQRGIPELRTSIAAYMTRVYGSPFADGAETFRPERFFVTAGGMHAIQIAVRLVSGTGDEILVPTPAWPNFVGAIGVGGATPVEVPMEFRTGADARWQLDLGRLEAAVTRRTRAVVLNSPSNPSGWVAETDFLRAVLALARRHGLWIIADEIYGRITYGGARAASFHDVMDENDKILFVQTMSKNWAMTGWRVGWLEAPEALGQTIENLMQYSTSGVAVPFQRGAVEALDHGDEWVMSMVERSQRSRDVLCDALRASGSMEFARPEAAFYLFCRAHGIEDGRIAAMRLVDEAGLGVAPGAAFGAAHGAFLRICFARDPEEMEEVARRFVLWAGRA